MDAQIRRVKQHANVWSNLSRENISTSFWKQLCSYDNPDKQ